MRKKPIVIQDGPQLNVALEVAKNCIYALHNNEVFTLCTSLFWKYLDAIQKITPEGDVQKIFLLGNNTNIVDALSEHPSLCLVVLDPDGPEAEQSVIRLAYFNSVDQEEELPRFLEYCEDCCCLNKELPGALSFNMALRVELERSVSYTQWKEWIEDIHSVQDFIARGCRIKEITNSIVKQICDSSSVILFAGIPLRLVYSSSYTFAISEYLLEHHQNQQYVGSWYIDETYQSVVNLVITSRYDTDFSDIINIVGDKVVAICFRSIMFKLNLDEFNLYLKGCGG